MWAAGCIVLATPLPMVATRTALVAHTPRFFLSRAAHLCARCWLFLAHVTPMRPPPLRPSVVPRSAHGPRFHKRRKKPQASKKFLCLTLFSFTHFFFAFWQLKGFGNTKTTVLI